MAYPTTQEKKLLAALENLLAFLERDSQVDMQTDPRLREEFARVRESAAAVAAEARKIFRHGI